MTENGPELPSSSLKQPRRPHTAPVNEEKSSMGVYQSLLVLTFHKLWNTFTVTTMSMKLLLLRNLLSIITTMIIAHRSLVIIMSTKVLLLIIRTTCTYTEMRTSVLSINSKQQQQLRRFDRRSPTAASPSSTSAG